MLFVNKLKVLTLMTCLVLVGQGFASNFWADHVSQPTNDTTIDNKSFYVVSSAEELAWIALETATDHPSNEKNVSLNFILKNDIDLAGKIWTPICPGGGNVHCNGIFDGAGHKIMNMTIVSDSIYARYHALYPSWTGKNDMGSKYVQNAGLVGTLGSGTIKNLNVTDVSFSITNGTDSQNQISVGPLVGWKDGNGGKIDFCGASGKIVTSGAKQGVGGLVGNAHSSSIKNSISFTNIYASGDSAFVGGIIGLTKNKTIDVESCVYAGDTLVSTGSGAMVGAVTGKVVSGGVNPKNTYFDSSNVNIPAVGNKTVTGVTGTDDLNSESVVCVLNGGKWNENTNECSVATENWSVGLSGLSLNGSDGYKVKFDANGGTFASGAKTYKILAAGEVVTADEIGIPARGGKKFGGWATSADTTEPSENLGVAEKSKVVYAVWYDFFDVTFNWNSESYTTQVAKHGIVAVDGFAVPKAYESDSGKYYFTGWAYEAKWFKDETYEIQPSDTIRLASIDVTQNVDLYAVWTKAKTFSVTFNATLHGTNEVQIVRIVNEGDPASEPDTIITDPGYKLVGWYTADEYPSGEKYNFDLPLEDDLVLYAKWEVVDYTITYELNDGENAVENPSTYNINTDDIVLANPTKNGATFDGWFYDEQRTKRATQISKGSSGDKTFYAKWTPFKYTIHYLSGSMATGTIPAEEKEYGEPKQLLGLVEKFALNGCEQDGWSRTDLGDKAFELGGTYEDNDDLMLYPHWTCQSFGITYDLLGGYGIGVNHKDNPSTYTGPAKLTLKNAYDSQNRIFSNGWYREPTLKTVIRYVEKLDAPITVYARWYNKITFQPGAKLTNSGYKDGKVEKQKDLNASYALNIPNNKFTIANYTLDGWSTTDGGEKAYDVGFAYRDNVNITLYPHWTANTHTITYNNVETSELPEGYPVTYTHEASVTLPVPSRKGYEFLGWYVDGEFNGDAVVEIPANQTEDKEFFAKWSDPIEYSITYVIDGEPTVLTPDEFTVVDNVTLAVPEMADGYIFDGWYLDEGMTGEKVTGFGAGTYAANQTFYGKWIRTYRITYVDADGLENPNPTSYTVLENDLELQPVSKSGFKFLGWFNDNDELVESISKNSAEDITLTAHWAEFPVLVSTYGGIEIFENEDGTKTAEIDGTSEKRVNIPTADNISVNQVVFNRDFSGGVKSTVMFPFTVSLNDVSGGEFWEFMAMEYSSETGWLFRIKEPDDNELKANKPYIFIADQESKNIEFNLSNSVSFSTDIMNPSVNNGWAFKGVYEKVSFNEDHPEWKYAYGYSGEQKRNVTKGSFIRLKSTGFEKIDLAPMRAYLVYDKSLAKSARISDNANIGSLPEFIDVEIVGKKGLAIGGGVLNTTTGELKMDRWYDLRGRKLNGKPTTQGTYYYNGKRIIVR